MQPRKPLKIPDLRQRIKANVLINFKLKTMANIQSIEMVLNKEIARQAYEAGMEKMKHPDSDCLYEDFEDWWSELQVSFIHQKAIEYAKLKQQVKIAMEGLQIISKKGDGASSEYAEELMNDISNLIEPAVSNNEGIELEAACKHSDWTDLYYSSGDYYGRYCNDCGYFFE